MWEELTSCFFSDIMLKFMCLFYYFPGVQARKWKLIVSAFSFNFLVNKKK